MRMILPVLIVMGTPIDTGKGLRTFGILVADHCTEVQTYLLSVVALPFELHRPWCCHWFYEIQRPCPWICVSRRSASTRKGVESLLFLPVSHFLVFLLFFTLWLKISCYASNGTEDDTHFVSEKLILGPRIFDQIHSCLGFWTLSIGPFTHRVFGFLTRIVICLLLSV